MSPMQNGSKFTDRIIKYLTKSAERKTTRASKSKGHVISQEYHLDICHKKGVDNIIADALSRVHSLDS